MAWMPNGANPDGRPGSEKARVGRLTGWKLLSKTSTRAW